MLLVRKHAHQISKATATTFAVWKKRNATVLRKYARGEWNREPEEKLPPPTSGGGRCKCFRADVGGIRTTYVRACKSTQNLPAALLALCQPPVDVYNIKSGTSVAFSKSV